MFSSLTFFGVWGVISLGAKIYVAVQQYRTAAAVEGFALHNYAVECELLHAEPKPEGTIPARNHLDVLTVLYLVQTHALGDPLGLSNISTLRKFLPYLENYMNHKYGGFVTRSLKMDLGDLEIIYLVYLIAGGVAKNGSRLWYGFSKKVNVKKDDVKVDAKVDVDVDVDVKDDVTVEDLSDAWDFDED